MRALCPAELGSRFSVSRMGQAPDQGQSGHESGAYNHWGHRAGTTIDLEMMRTAGMCLLGTAAALGSINRWQLCSQGRALGAH